MYLDRWSLGAIRLQFGTAGGAYVLQKITGELLAGSGGVAQLTKRCAKGMGMVGADR